MSAVVHRLPTESNDREADVPGSRKRRPPLHRNSGALPVDRRSSALVGDQARSGDTAPHDTASDKDVGQRPVEVLEAVVDELIVGWYPAAEDIDRQRSSCAASNCVVSNDVVVSEAPDGDPGARVAEHGARTRRHDYIVILDQGALHRPFCELAEHRDAYSVWLVGLDSVIRHQIRSRVDEANRVIARSRLSARAEGVPQDAHAPVDAANVDRSGRRVPDPAAGAAPVPPCPPPRPLTAPA